MPGGLTRAVWLVVIGILSVQFGAAIAKDLFDEVTPTALVWLRLATSAVFLALIARPVLSGRTRHDWVVVLGFGLSLGTMNWAIYQSFARIPLGVAVTIEFVGPLVLAAVGSHRARDLVWVVLAAAGVILLGAEPGAVTLAGVLFALLAGAAWAAYILLSASTGRRWPGLDGLAVASVVAGLVLLPYAAVDGAGARPRRPDPGPGGVGRPAQLGRPLQPGARRAAQAPAGHVRHPDESRACGRSAGRDGAAPRVPEPGPVVGDGLRRGREHRRDAVRQSAGGTRARLTAGRCHRRRAPPLFTHLSSAVDVVDPRAH